MAIEKLTTRLKYITRTNSKINQPLKQPRNQTDHTPDVTQKSKTHLNS
jgi:hypothetical protein